MGFMKRAAEAFRRTNEQRKTRQEIRPSARVRLLRENRYGAVCGGVRGTSRLVQEEAQQRPGPAERAAITLLKKMHPNGEEPQQKRKTKRRRPRNHLADLRWAWKKAEGRARLQFMRETGGQGCHQWVDVKYPAGVKARELFEKSIKTGEFIDTDTPAT